MASYLTNFRRAVSIFPSLSGKAESESVSLGGKEATDKRLQLRCQLLGAAALVYVVGVNIGQGALQPVVCLHRIVYR